MRKFREWNPLLFFDVAVVVLFVLMWEFCWNIVFPECCHVCVKELYLVRTWVVCSCVHSQMLPLLLEQSVALIFNFFYFVCLMTQQYFLFLFLANLKCTVNSVGRVMATLLKLKHMRFWMQNRPMCFWLQSGKPTHYRVSVFLS